MLLESLILGGIVTNAVVTLAPGLLGLAERVTDSRNFTIRLAAIGPEVTVVDIDAPSELMPGTVPTVNVTVRHNRVLYEWIFARLVDADTGQVVCPMKKKWVQAEKDFNFTFMGLGPAGDWAAVMPSRDWNLRLEVGLWWL